MILKIDLLEIMYLLCIIKLIANIGCQRILLDILYIINLILLMLIIIVFYSIFQKVLNLFLGTCNLYLLIQYSHKIHFLIILIQFNDFIIINGNDLI